MNYQRYLEKLIDLCKHLLKWLRVNLGVIVHTGVEKFQACVIELALCFQMAPEFVQGEGTANVGACENHEQAKVGEFWFSFRMIK